MDTKCRKLESFLYKMDNKLLYKQEEFLEQKVEMMKLTLKDLDSENDQLRWVFNQLLTQKLL